MIATKVSPALVKKWFSDGKLNDSTEYQSDGRGYSVYWDGRGVKRGEGPRINHAKDGEWKFFRTSGELITRETYILDSLIAIRCFEPDGTPSTGECIAEKNAEFPRGLDAWHRYVTKKVESNKKQLIKHSANGIVDVSFIIGTDGKIEEPKIENPKGGYFEEFALSVIRDAPQWIPAIQHNQRVRTYMKQPISFRYE